jgi:GH24 family phage-related lysozyme (muramidase)
MEEQMKLSANGEAFIKEFEGYRDTPYQCSANVWTIGWGHTKNVKKHGVWIANNWLDDITKNQAHDLFLEDVMQFELAVRRLVQVELTQNQFDALVSFAFNLGGGALQKSTLLKKLNAKDYDGAAKEFKKWNRADGKVIAGLVKRRKAEAELFANDIGYEHVEGQYQPDPNNTPIPYQTLPLPTAHQEYGEPVAPMSTVRKSLTVATTGVAGAGGIATIITDPQIITSNLPAVLSFLQAVDWRVAITVVIVVVCALLWIRGRK